MSFDWKSIVRSVAPVLGTALGGPLTGTAVKFLGDKLLGNPDATEMDVAEAITSASPEQLVRLKELNAEFQLSMKKLGIDLERIRFEDRKSARELFKVNKWPQIILSTGYTIGYFIVIFFVFNGRLNDLDPKVFGIAATILGILTTAIPQILQFWFGSSSGSKDKDTTGLDKQI